MKNWKRALIVVVAVLLVVAIIAVDNIVNRAPAYNPDNYSDYVVKAIEPVVEDRQISTEDALVKVGESEGLQLLYNSVKNELRVTTADSSVNWDSFVSPGMMEPKEGEYPSTLFNAVIASSVTGNTMPVDTQTSDCTMTCTALKNGVAVKVDFTDYQVSITVQFWLENGILNARVPHSSIVEEGEYSLVNIEILPYFGAAGNGENGYIVFPDGAGALYRFGDEGVRISTPLVLDVYGSRSTDIDEYNDMQMQGIRNCMMPFFGMKNDKGAFVAYVSEGDASAAITLAPNGHIHPIDRVYATSVYRRVTAKSGESGIEIYQVEEESRGADFAVSYFFNGTADADYSWMASELRTWMTETGRLSSENNKSKDAYVELLMGARKTNMLGSTYVSLTTVDQAKDILDEIHKKPVELAVSLLGWQNHGYGNSPGNFSAAGSIGGNKEIKNFESEKDDIYLDVPLDFGTTESTGFRKRKDGIVTINNVTLVGKDGENYVVNANTQYLKLKDMLKKRATFADKGLSATGLANILFDDYNTYSSMTRKQVMEVQKAEMDMLAKTGKLALKNANAYSLPYVNMLSDMPSAASGYTALNESVPFYYLVINGTVAYSLDLAGNQSPDIQKTKLQWLEYGAIPYFLLTSAENNELHETSADGLFSTNFAERSDSVIEVIEECANVYSQLEGQRMSAHRRISKDFFITEYNGGSYILINYNDSAKTYNGVTVEGRSYTVKQK